jgi:2-polyprenyl-3-methyl-5-hydroxy-6-metoxy-1,4-benzoquinol methylase
VKEFEIRPRKLFSEYLELSKRDIEVFFSDHSDFENISCPGCKSNKANTAFIKHGFEYKKCPECFTLFTSPRPTNAMISDFYRRSESSRFWAEHFYPETAEARREMIFKPRAEVINKLLNEFEIPEPRSIVDVGAGYGIFLEEIRKYGFFDEVIAVEPNKDLAKCCREKNISVYEAAVEDIKDGELKASVVCSFEVFEHLFDPDSFIMSMKKLLKPGGILLFTTLTISGFDLLVLGENSKSISPPHHINFLSVEGIRALIRRCGLTELLIETPGKLDVDIVKNMYEELPELKLPDFVEYLIKNRDSAAHNDFQQFLQKNNLSSHIRVIARNNG